MKTISISRSVVHFHDLTQRTKCTGIHFTIQTFGTFSCNVCNVVMYCLYTTYHIYGGALPNVKDCCIWYGKCLLHILTMYHIYGGALYNVNDCSI